MQTEPLTEDLLTSEDDYERATAGKRFLNYLVDCIVFYILVIIGAFIFYIIIPPTVNSRDSGLDYSILDRILFLVLYATYMGIMEGLFKGRSIGKFLTGTRAVNLDGTTITTSTAFARGFSRAVPFCAFSAFGSPCNPWQDKWTNTMVVVNKNR